jgi:GDP-L-fucose synthase
MLDLETRLLNEQYGCRYSTLMPVTVFGPNDNFDLESGHVIGALIHKCFLAKKENKPLEVWGSGQAVRQFVFAKDVAKLLVLALNSFQGPETIVVAPDSGITIRELALKIAKVMDFKGEIRFNPDKPEGQYKRVVQSSVFPRTFPDFRFTPLEEGLHETVQWFTQYQASLDFSAKKAVNK